MKPCCNPIFILAEEAGRPTRVRAKPCQPDTWRYSQTAVVDAISVTKNIATSASIIYLLKTSPIKGPAK
jgi:hypothetical protein